MIQLSRVSWSILILLLVLPWTRAVGMVLFSLLVHEWAHVFIAKWHGAKVEIRGLSVFGFIAHAKNLDKVHPRHRFMVYAAGPLANIAMAVWAFTVHHVSYVGVYWLRDLAFYNAVLAAFNLLPILPLDGGRLVQHCLGNVFGIIRTNRFLLRFGRGVAIVLAGFGFIQIVLFSYNITLLLIAIFLWRKNASLHAVLRLECFLTLQKKSAVLHGPRGYGKFKIKSTKIKSEKTVLQAVERLGWSHMREFNINGKPLREEKLLHYIFSATGASFPSVLAVPIGRLV